MAYSGNQDTVTDQAGQEASRRRNRLASRSELVEVGSLEDPGWL